ncbi:GNA-3 g alpha subunit GNA-3 [Fusarium coicis]|nr:GNA-3 g alpha subunit GNA-3 [Fusarium coicis]
MADPLSIIGTAGAIANIIDVLTKTITTVCDMRQAWKIADLSVFAFENQLNLLKFALFEIQKWTESRSCEQSHQLVMQVDSCVTCCRLLIGKIDGEVSQFQKTTAGDLELGSKLSFLFKTKDMEQIQRMVDQQTHTLTLLLSACNSNALVEQTRILQQPKLVQALQDMDRDTASLIVHRDSDSIITATSVSSSRWSVQFAFDRELFISKVYDKWIRKLATTRRANTHSTEDSAQRDHQQISNNGIAVRDPPNDHEQNIVARESVSKSYNALIFMIHERFMFDGNGEYFLKQVERILQHNYFPTDSDAVNCATPLPYPVEAAFNLGRSTMLLTDPGNTEFSWTKGFDTAVIYVLDLSSPYDEALLNFESTVKLQIQRPRTFSLVVIVNNFKDFMKRLLEASLSGVESSEYTGGNDTEKAAKYFASKIKYLSPGGIHLHVRFTGGVYEERNLRKIWAMLQEVINNNKLYSVGII